MLLHTVVLKSFRRALCWSPRLALWAPTVAASQLSLVSGENTAPQVTCCIITFIPFAGIFLSGGPGVIAPPLNFDNPKRSKMLYVTCGTIIRCVVVDVLDVL